MKRVVVILAGLAFLGSAPLALARDANRDALWATTKARQGAQTAAVTKQKKEASKDFVKVPDKPMKAKKAKSGKKKGA